MMMTVIQVLRAFKVSCDGGNSLLLNLMTIMINLGDGLSVMLDGKRKSTRGHQRPLEYWRNEHKVFGRDHKSEC